MPIAVQIVIAALTVAQDAIAAATLTANAVKTKEAPFAEPLLIT